MADVNNVDKVIEEVNKPLKESDPELEKIITPDSYNGDFTWCDNSSVILVSKRVALIPDFKHLEVCSIKNNIEYSLLLVDELDCLDYKKSKIEYFNNTTKIKGISKYCFKKDVIKENHLYFKIKGLDYSPVFFTKRFLRLYKANGLSGLEFKRV